MAKYKLTVKYNNVCDLSIAGDIPDIIANEFDQYVKSMLYKREEWENFEANFKLAAKKEYGNIKKARREAQKQAEKEQAKDDTLEKETPEESKKNLEPAPEDSVKKEVAKENSPAENEEIKEDDKTLNNEDEKAREEEVPEEEKEQGILTFEEYIKNKNIKTPLDEFVAGACYFDEILDIKEFSLKQLNAKLFPAFGRLASSEVISEAIDRVLIETIKDGARQRYVINQNAWNYHNYDLVKPSQDKI